MNLSFELVLIGKMLLASLLTYILGKEREVSKKPIGIRTTILIGCATTLFSSIAAGTESYFIFIGVISGIGFLGGGVIMKEEGRVTGLTTAALIWMIAAIGICIGLDFYLTAILSTFLSFLILKSKKFKLG